ncbi:Mce family protein Mce3D [Mycolicibacterium chitae]|uniref:Virulence factor Mce family protein n=1 Tax=Mycolicibacterium chitae TaxID=1792 RepID=A0A3S4RJE0_MYCCI|nr:MCE family protein [Mycolicibacterium chitae]MCV7108522.1 MCE family protein [Mycolicibacterium chitae]BBZ00754.1 Mce family protein Mce3D [Mycolicibacterium chitae]VEG49602.1 virulence factor Mce family protein [Mycolicibacterium chitae]
MRKPTLRTGLIVALVLVVVAGGVLALRAFNQAGRTNVVAYFDNSNGLFVGDEVRILGFPVGAVESIEPEPSRVKVSFWVKGKYQVPADAKAVIVSPQLVTARAIQLTPAYTSGPVLENGAVIGEDRTAVPLEWDDLRAQLEKLSDALQPTEPGGVSTLGQFVNTAAENLRGQGVNIRETVTTMSQALSALGDHSDDTFASLKNLSVVVTALEDSSQLLGQLNRNLAAVTGLLADDPGAVGAAINDLNSVVGTATQFVRENREAAGIAVDKLASISTAVHGSLDDIEQALHSFPTAAQNFANVYQPSQGALTGMLAVNNFADPMSLVCGSVEAAARLNSEYSAKLCMQYLAPIVKNRQMNFPPLGENLFVGQSARPNELTYSEDRLRPDYYPVQNPAPAPPAETAPVAVPVGAADPAAGLPGLLLPAEGGS